VGVGGEAAVGAQADEDGDRGLGQALRQLRGIVAGVENEQGRRLSRRPPRQKRRDLLSGDGVGVLSWMDTAHVEGDSPAVSVEAELGQPLVRPTSDDRLPSRVAGRMVLETPLRTCLGVAAGPDAEVDGEDRLAAGGGSLGQRRAQHVDVEAPLGQSLVDAAPATSMRCLKAEVGQ
jgi:hypothetical protein